MQQSESQNRVRSSGVLMGAAGALSVFGGAFLLFQVQPIMGRFILPTFGGSPDVWTTCVLFFQLLLLGGYAWAHYVATRLSGGRQAAVYILLLAAALAALPIVPAGVRPDPSGRPVVQILVMLVRSVGLPFFVLASTSPLIQVWFGRSVGAAPYRLYALSNAGSLLALLTYPFLFEPFLSRHLQARFWGWGLGAFAAVGAAAAFFYGVSTRGGGAGDGAARHAKEGAAPGWQTRALWMALPAGASVVLLAVTNKMSQDITTVSLFWVVPLAVYLLSFILCFDHSRWYVRKLWVIVFVPSFIGLVAAGRYAPQVPAWAAVTVHTLTLFSCCMVFHGELYRLRPHTSRLTEYYLSIAAGGALGGVFVVVVAPLVFSTYFELYVGLLGCCLFILLTQPNMMGPGAGRRRLVWTCLVIATGAVGFTMQRSPHSFQGKSLARSRNFFGVITVWEREDGWGRTFRIMQHGDINHGLQFTGEADRARATAYYGKLSGVGLAIEALPEDAGRRIGFIGLGVGTVATYGREGDRFVFYEINPEVERQARRFFTYLDDSAADVEIVLGDARLSLANEAPREYDLLVVDAFTGDAVPVHLLTVEAFEVYLRHLSAAPHATVALHVSSNHVDLPSVVRRLGEHFGLREAWIESFQDDYCGTLDSDWILLSRGGELLEKPVIRSAAIPAEPLRPKTPLWTDDHANLLRVLK